MSENKDVENMELNEVIKRMMNEILEAQGSEPLKLRVEEIDAGIYP